MKGLESFDSKGEQKAHALKVFGNKETSIIPYHHQWLFGMTAAAVCANIMREVHKSDHLYHILSKEIDGLPYPSDYNGKVDKVDGFLEVLRALFFHQFDCDFAANGARYGIERAFETINEAYDGEKYERRSDCRMDFTLGDNNDGITIIDVVNKKYCFMNIGFGDSTVMTLPALVPLSAKEYVRAYYPTERKKLGSYEINDECGGDETKMQEKLTDHRKKVSFVEKVFENFSLLTLAEVEKMFPAVYKTKKEKVKSK